VPSVLRRVFMARLILGARIVSSFSGLCILLLLWQGQIVAEAQNADRALSFSLVLSQKGCQLAIWIEDEHGSFVDTIYVTRKIAKKGMGNRKGDLDAFLGGARPSALPVWAHRRGVDYGGGNFYPPKDKPLPDAVTSATPKAGEFVWTWKPEKGLKPGSYFYYVEVNKSFDKNDHHDYSWYRGQPSVVWRGTLEVGPETSKSQAEIIGHGHVAGADGEIHSDLSTITTALSLIESVEAVYRP
jgi:hypothetical protein